MKPQRPTALKVLVLGATGMLGHKVWQAFTPRFETFATTRSEILPLFEQRVDRVIAGVNANDFESVERAVAQVEPDVLVNCIGIVKQLDAAKDPITSIEINSLFPHRLERLASGHGARLIQISTDCVFSGRKGGYSERDLPDPTDLYGRTKLLGETIDEDALTVRTSIVGRELIGASGLLEWFLSQNGSVRGYRRAIFSGLTTEALAETLASVIAEHPSLSGVLHVASEPIDKFELLQRFADAYDREIEVEPDDSVVIDRSLDDSRFRSATGIPRPSWDEMLARLASDSTPYETLRPVPC